MYIFQEKAAYVPITVSVPNGILCFPFLGCYGEFLVLAATVPDHCIHFDMLRI